MSERPSRTRTLILSSGALQRAAWTALLQPQPALDLCGGAATVEAVLALATAKKVNAIMVDLPGPEAAVVHQLAQQLPQGELLCLVDTYHLPQLIELIQAGAMGCLSGEATVDELARALVAVGRGELVLPPALANPVLVALARGGLTAVAPETALTEREQQVVRLLAAGRTNKEIAQTLILSVRTVEAHLRNIFGKLDVSSRTEAALWAVRRGYTAD